MAVLKFGAIVTEGSGSLGGHTIQNSQGGSTLRTKPIPRGNPSAAQLSIRSINQQLQAGWKALTPSQQKIWNDWPSVHGIMNAKGDKHPLSGHSLWLKYNYTWLAAGGDFLPDPSYWPSPIIGPEIIYNGTFDGDFGWFKGPSWSISAGKANYDDTGNNFICQSKNIYLDFNYRISFDISDCPDFTRILFWSYQPTYLFQTPLNNYLLLPNGHYVYYAKGFGNTTLINIIGYTSGSAFKLDNLSIKQIL